MPTASRTSAQPNQAAPRALVSLAALGLLAALHTGCGGTAEDEGSDAGTGTDAGTGVTFTSLYGTSALKACAQCHAPGAQGRTAGTEATQDWSTRDKAYASLKGKKASGLTGNFEACNGALLVGDTADESLIVAALDPDVRERFASPDAPDCNADTISDMTVKVGGSFSASVLTQLKAWINAGAPNN